MSTSRADRAGSVAVALGPLAAFGVGALLGAARDDVRQANVALALAIVVILAALAGRAAGVTTAIVAALTYNFFHTVPFHSLRISAVGDVVTVVLLIVIGIVVSEVGAWRRRTGAASAPAG